MFIVPDEINLIDFFGSLPESGEEYNDCWCYQIIDNKGIKLTFSCNESEKSIQVKLSFGDHPLIIFSSESASAIKIQEDKSGKYLSCEFKYEGAIVRSEIRVQPTISIYWAAIR